jgi:hypothetical protein
MYLAGILGLCALMQAPPGSVHGGHSLLARTISLALTNPVSGLRRPPSPEPAPSKPEAKSPGSQQGNPPGSAPSPAPADQVPTNQVPTNQVPGKPAAEVKPDAARKRKRAQKKPPPPATGNQEPKKTVVQKGSTLEPATQLTPGITEEQAARQRQTTRDLLSSTNANLQKLNTRLLSGDEQATVAQIREFIEQSNVADKAGDLQRAYKLAVKAHLLSDALVQQ